MDDDAPSQDSDDPLIECLTFTLGNETYGSDGNPAIRGTCQKDDKLYILLSVHELRQDIEAVKTA